MTSPSFERDAVRLCHLRRRTDLNGIYGLVQSKQGPDSYEVRIGRKSILAKFANLEFVGHVPLVFDMDGLSPEMMKDLCKTGLVIDSAMRDKYMAPLFKMCSVETSNV